MKLDFRSVLALAVPIPVLLFLAWLVFDWYHNYAEFRADLAVGGLVVGIALLALLLVRPQRGRPSILTRDMDDKIHGAPGGCAPGHYLPPSARSHQTFASTVGGHIARSLGHLQRLVGLGAGHQSQLLLRGEAVSA